MKSEIAYAVEAGQIAIAYADTDGEAQYLFDWFKQLWVEERGEPAIAKTVESVERALSDILVHGLQADDGDDPTAYLALPGLRRQLTAMCELYVMVTALQARLNGGATDEDERPAY